MMTLPLFLALCILACYRLARMLARDTGPFGIFETWRALAGQWASGGKQYGLAWTVAEGLHCPFCVGVWVAMPLAMIVYWSTNINLIEFLIVWLAIAGGQALMEANSGSGGIE